MGKKRVEKGSIVISVESANSKAIREQIMRILQRCSEYSELKDEFGEFEVKEKGENSVVLTSKDKRIKIDVILSLKSDSKTRTVRKNLHPRMREGWMSVDTLSVRDCIPTKWLREFIEPYLHTHEREFIDNNPEHLSPNMIKIIRGHLRTISEKRMEKPSQAEGWRARISFNIGRQHYPGYPLGKETLTEMMLSFAEDDKSAIRYFRRGMHTRAYFSPEVVKKTEQYLKERHKVDQGWLSTTEIESKYGEAGKRKAYELWLQGQKGTVAFAPNMKDEKVDPAALLSRGYYGGQPLTENEFKKAIPRMAEYPNAWLYISPEVEKKLRKRR